MIAKPRTIITLALVLYLLACGTSPDGSRARAAEFARRANWDVSSVDCQKWDSDDNSYISCSVFLKDGTVEALDCPAWSNCNDSCRKGTVKQ